MAVISLGVGIRQLSAATGEDPKVLIPVTKKLEVVAETRFVEHPVTIAADWENAAGFKMMMAI